MCRLITACSWRPLQFKGTFGLVSANDHEAVSEENAHAVAAPGPVRSRGGTHRADCRWVASDGSARDRGLEGSCAVKVCHRLRARLADALDFGHRLGFGSPDP